MAAFLAKLLDPVSFVVALVVVLFSKKKWIILLAAALAAVIVETGLYSMQETRVWGQGLPTGFLASLAHASIVFGIRSRRGVRKQAKTGSPAETKVSEKPQDGGDNPIGAVEVHLNNMGYDLTPYGAGVALLELESGYNAVETASHISLTTLALDVKDAGTNIEKLMRFMPHAMALLEVLKSYKDKGMMHPTQWQNDTNAIWRVSTVDEHQEEWIEKVLSDPIAGKERLATSRVDYRAS
jgi:hypothetical protein